MAWTQAQVENWIAANGGAGNVQFIESNVPARASGSIVDALLAAELSGRPLDPSSLMDTGDGKTKRVLSWVNSATGARLIVEPQSDDAGNVSEYNLVKDVQADPNKRPPAARKTVVQERTERDSAGRDTKITTYDDGAETREYESDTAFEARKRKEAADKVTLDNTAADNARADAALNVQLANLGISREKWEAEKGKPVQAGNGRWYQWDAASGALKDVTPTSGASPIKPLGPQPYGRLAAPLSRALQNVYNDATLTNEEKLSRAQVLVNEAKTMESEFTNQINATRGIYGDQVQQRGQTLTDVASRRALGDKSAQMGYDTAKNLLGSLDDPSQAGALMRMMIGLPGQQATALGGMRDVPEIQLPVAAQQVLNTPLGGTPLPPGYGAMVQGQSPQGGFLGGMTQQPMAPSPQQDEYTRWLLSQGIPGAEQYVAR